MGTEQKPAEETTPVTEENKGVLSKIGEVMKEILLPPTEDLGEPTLKTEEEKPATEVKKSPLSSPALPASASSSSKRESESLSGKADIGTAEFQPARTAIMKSSAEPVQLKATDDLSDAKKRLALLLQPAVRSYLGRKSWSAGTSEKKIDTVEASERIQRSARRWLLHHRAEQRRKTGSKMTEDEASRIIQERCRRWLDSTGFAEHKKTRKHKKRNHKKAEEKHEESKLEHFGRLVREARGELPEGSATQAAAPAPADKAHLSAPAKAHLVEMIQQAVEVVKNRDESHLPKLKEADLFKPVIEPVPQTRPEPTHTPQDSGAPGHFIQQPRA